MVVCTFCRRPESNGGTCNIKAECAKNPKLNLGSGEMIKKEMINFDMTEFVMPAGKTDVLGKIEDITTLFPANFFAEILCAHVIEHFYPTDAKKVINDIKAILRPGGKLIMEAPDIMGCYDHYVLKGKQGGLPGFISAIYGNEPHRLKWGDEWMHKWGWTGKIMSDTLASMGFKVVHVGIGLTHGMGGRDFRVEAIKQ